MHWLVYLTCYLELNINQINSQILYLMKIRICSKPNKVACWLGLVPWGLSQCGFLNVFDIALNPIFSSYWIMRKKKKSIHVFFLQHKKSHLELPLLWILVWLNGGCILSYYTPIFVQYVCSCKSIGFWSSVSLHMVDFIYLSCQIIGSSLLQYRLDLKSWN